MYSVIRNIDYAHIVLQQEALVNPDHVIIHHFDVAVIADRAHPEEIREGVILDIDSVRHSGKIGRWVDDASTPGIGRADTDEGVVFHLQVVGIRRQGADEALHLDVTHFRLFCIKQSNASHTLTARGAIGSARAFQGQIFNDKKSGTCLGGRWIPQKQSKSAGRGFDTGRSVPLDFDSIGAGLAGR